MKKWIAALFAACFLMLPVTALANTQAGKPVAHQQSIQTKQSISASKSDMQNTIFFRGGHSSYHSGFRSPSSRIGGSHWGSSYGYGHRSLFSGFGSHMFSFGAGWFLGGMFHPFGGYYGYGYHHFSFFGILFDIIIIWIIWRIIRRMFR